MSLNGNDVHQLLKKLNSDWDQLVFLEKFDADGTEFISLFSG